VATQEFNRAFLLTDFQPDWNDIDMSTLRGGFYKVWSKRMDLLRGFSTYDDECNGKVGVEEFKDCLESTVADISEDEMVDMLKTCEVWQSHIDYGLWLDIVNYSVAGDDWLHGGAGESLQMLNSELFQNTSECHKWFEVRSGVVLFALPRECLLATVMRAHRLRMSAAMAFWTRRASSAK